MYTQTHFNYVYDELYGLFKLIGPSRQPHATCSGVLCHQEVSKCYRVCQSLRSEPLRDITGVQKTARPAGLTEQLPEKFSIKIVGYHKVAVVRAAVLSLTCTLSLPKLHRI